MGVIESQMWNCPLATTERVARAHLRTRSCLISGLASSVSANGLPFCSNAAGVSEVSPFSYMKFLGVPGVFDYAGLRGLILSC
jgi:hypothetical protein